MWSLEFWQSFLDDLARRRFNVLTLWSLHPFPSIVKVPEFPDVALDDVWRTRVALDDTFSPAPESGIWCARRCSGRPRGHQKANHRRENQVLARGHAARSEDRGIDVYWFTWNIFLFEASKGRTASPQIRPDRAPSKYFRASVRETVKTYPLLVGLGITAGEQMSEKIGGLSKEQWLWQSYGEGIRDALREVIRSVNSG